MNRTNDMDKEHPLDPKDARPDVSEKKPIDDESGAEVIGAAGGAIAGAGLGAAVGAGAGAGIGDKTEEDVEDDETLDEEHQKFPGTQADPDRQRTL